MKRRLNNNFEISDMYCTKCGRRNIPIARIKGKYREAGHLKKLYCIYCKEEVNHCEIRQFGKYTLEDFKKEFELGRFINGERVPISKCKDCKNNLCKFNVNGKCWNCKIDCERVVKHD